MANKKFSDYVVAGDNITLTYDNNADTVTIDAAGNVDSVNGQVGVVVLTKTDIGLGNVDNTSDANKPISTATQTALNSKQDTLISGTNIKTINNSSILGVGNIDLPTYIRKHDFNVYDYLGYALTGSLESDSVWHITRLTISSAGSVTAFGVATNVKWTDRYTVIYT